MTICFQPNAWCDEATMGRWIRDCWKPNALPDTLLIADIHRAQTTNAVKYLLRECNTYLVLVPAGCTSLVQPIDVVFNNPFKNSIEKLAMQHMHDHLHDYLTGKLSASEQRVFFTRWIRQAWQETSTNKEMIVRSFKKCGISTAIDGSEDYQISIPGLKGYCVDDDALEDDPFTDQDSDTE